LALQEPPDLLNFQLRLRHLRRQISFPVDDSCREAVPKGSSIASAASIGRVFQRYRRKAGMEFSSKVDQFGFRLLKLGAK
jgi:hypothetical protein